MKVRWIITEDTPTRFVEQGTVAEVDAEAAKALLDAGLVEPVVEKQERAVKAPARKAVKE